MKRGLIAWNKQEMSPAVFNDRVRRVRELLLELGLPALVVYSELWRSNSARFLSNYMPYFNRALLILPAEGAPTLFCGLSPRVYGWIRSVTTIDDVKPAGNFARPLAQLVAERGWDRLGCLELEKFPQDLHKALTAESIDLVSIDLSRIYPPGNDDAELAMRRKAVVIAYHALEEEMPNSVGRPDHRLVGRLERRLRRDGVEDVIVLVNNGDAVPAQPIGAILKEHFSLSLAVEYRGHWVRLSRFNGPQQAQAHGKSLFDEALAGSPAATPLYENLSGSYPYECMSAADLKPGNIVAIHIHFEHAGRRLFYGDTCIYDPPGFRTI